MLHCHPPSRPAYVIDAGTLCRGILAFCRSRAIHAGGPNPAAALLDDWLKDDTPTFEWIYSEETLLVYEAVLRRLGLSSRLIDRVIGTIKHMGLSAAPPIGGGDSTCTIEEVFSAAAEAVEEAAIVTPDPARFPHTGRIRVVTPAEAVADMAVRAGYAERAAGLPAAESPSGPIARGWPA